MTRRKIASSRRDGRGGWIKGKRRHADCGDWSRIRISLCALINDRWQMGVISARVLARDLDVSEKTVRRWMAGEDRPIPEMQEAVRQWIAEHR
jgi:hypothetical protein